MRAASMRLKEIAPGGRPGSKVNDVPKIEDLEYVMDKKGRKKLVVMSYKAYRQLLEDYADLQVKSQRQHEAPEDFDKVLEDLRNAGRL